MSYRSKKTVIGFATSQATAQSMESERDSPISSSTPSRNLEKKTQSIGVTKPSGSTQRTIPTSIGRSPNVPFKATFGPFQPPHPSKFAPPISKPSMSPASGIQQSGKQPVPIEESTPSSALPRSATSLQSKVANLGSTPSAGTSTTGIQRLEKQPVLMQQSVPSNVLPRPATSLQSKVANLGSTPSAGTSTTGIQQLKKQSVLMRQFSALPTSATSLQSKVANLRSKTSAGTSLLKPSFQSKVATSTSRQYTGASMGTHSSKGSQQPATSQPIDSPSELLPTMHAASEPTPNTHKDPSMHAASEPTPNTHKEPFMNAASKPTQNTHKEPAVGDYGSEPLNGSNEETNQTASRKRKAQSSASSEKVPNWPDSIEVKDKEEVLTINADGNIEKVTGSVQPYHVDKLPAGTRYIVIFNALNQPIRKGGSILVKYLGYMARLERFCPIGASSWHQMDKVYKCEIVTLVREKFLIPEGVALDKAMLKHVDKHWRQFKHSLKKARFNPEIRSKQEIYDDIPEGHSRDNWRNLVKYWYSDKGQKLAANGREARALQNHLHTTGARSYANKRADFVEEKGREPGSIEWFEVTHETKDKNFVEGKITKQFLEDAKTEVEKILANSSSPKNRVEVENEVFNKLMYKEEIPKRPVGFGFGVNSSDVYGVHGMLRKSGYNCANKSHIEAAFANIMKENQELRKKNEAVESKLDVNQQLLIQLLNEMRNRNGHVSDDFLDNAQSVLKRGKSQVPDASSGYGARRTTESGDQSGSDDHRSSSSFHED